MSKFIKIGSIFLLGLAWAGPQDNSLVVGTSQEPTVLAGDFLNVISNQAIKSEIQLYLFAPLIGSDLEGANYPVLVTEVPSEANGRLRLTDLEGGDKRLELDLTLRPDARWSDGEPITTRDVDFYYQVGTAPGMPTPSPDYWERVGLRVKDEHNFTVSFEPAYNIDLVGTPISLAPAHIMAEAWQEVAAEAAKLDPAQDAAKLNELYTGFFRQFSTPEAINAGKMVYSGPFAATRWVAGSSLEMERNPHFPLQPENPEAYLERVTFRFITNTNSLLVALLGGDIDATSSVALSFEQATSPQLKARGDLYQAWLVPSPIWEHIDINQFSQVAEVKALGLDQVKTRQALLYALDREGLSQALFQGLQPVAHTWVSPYHPYFNPEATQYPHDPEKARQLLTELGWQPGPDGILVKDGAKFELEFVTTAGNVLRERVQQIVAQNFKDVGIAIKINNAPSAVVFADNYAPRGSEGAWRGMFMFAWVSNLAEDGALFTCHDLHTGAVFVPSSKNGYSGQNQGGWCNDQFDQLRAQAVSEFDPAKSQAIFAQMQEVWASEVPAIPLYFTSVPIVVKKDLVNFVTATYANQYGYPPVQPWLVGWQSRGAEPVFDQSKYAKPAF